MRQLRRIVTTDDQSGRSEVMIDGMAPRTISVLTEMWITDSRAPNHRDGIDHAERSDRLEPPAGGTLFRYFEVAPKSQTAHLSEEESAKPAQGRSPR